MWNISGNCFATQKKANHFHSSARKKLFLQTNFLLCAFSFRQQQSNDNSFHDTVKHERNGGEKNYLQRNSWACWLNVPFKRIYLFRAPAVEFLHYDRIQNERGGLFMNYISHLNIIFINYVPRTIINTHWVKLCEISAEISRYT